MITSEVGSQAYDREDSAGVLCFRLATRSDFEYRCDVKHDCKFDIGRDDVLKWLGTYDLTISAKHLRIRCITYGDDGSTDVAPLVYVRVLSSNAIVYKPAQVGAQRQGRRFTRSDGDILLGNDDALELTSTISIIFEASKRAWNRIPPLEEGQAKELRQLSSRYLITNRVLGSGAFATVLVAVNTDTGKQLACKALKARMDSSARIVSRSKIAREYLVLKDLNHPNIIALEKVFCSSKHTYLFQELVTGGDLFSYLERQGHLRESESAVIVFQLLNAIAYLHDHNVVHRDIKPENVLMTSEMPGARVILTDFGQARLLRHGDQQPLETAVFRMQSIVGTENFVAPEIARLKLGLDRAGGYSKAVDMWSLGCIAAAVLTFKSIVGENDYRQETRQLRDQHEWNLSVLDNGTEWKTISQSAKGFIRACLAVEESERPTAKDALAHAWFTNKRYADELRAAYARAISAWKPALRKDDLIEFLDETNAHQYDECPGMRQSMPFEKSKADLLPKKPIHPCVDTCHTGLRKQQPPSSDNVTSKHFQRSPELDIGDSKHIVEHAWDQDPPQHELAESKGSLQGTSAPTSGIARTTIDQKRPAEESSEELRRKLQLAIRESAAAFERSLEAKRKKMAC